MSKFTVLKFNEKFMMWLGVRSYRLNEQTNEFFSSIFPYYLLLVSISYTTSSFAFVYVNWPHLDIMIESCLVGIGGIQIIAIFFCFGSKMKKVKEVHLKLQEIVDEDSHGDIFKMYWGIEQKCRKYTTVMAIFLLADQSMIIASLFYSIYCILTGNYDTTQFLVPFKFVVPFSTTTILGWYLLWFFCLNACVAYAGLITSISAYFLSFCSYIHGMCNHFELVIASLQEEIEWNRFKRNPSKYEKNCRKIHEKLCEAVIIQVKTLEIFKFVADINSGIIFWLLPTSMLAISLSFYFIEYVSFEMVSLLFLLLCIFASLIWPFLFCYFATFATERVVRMDDVAYDFGWYEIPIKLQKYITLMIARSQRPTRFSGLNLVPCTLQSFGKLIQSSLSYYLIFRELTNR